MTDKELDRKIYERLRTVMIEHNSTYKDAMDNETDYHTWQFIVEREHIEFEKMACMIIRALPTPWGSKDD